MGGAVHVQVYLPVVGTPTSQFQTSLKAACKKTTTMLPLEKVRAISHLQLTVSSLNGVQLGVLSHDVPHARFPP